MRALRIAFWSAVLLAACQSLPVRIPEWSVLKSTPTPNTFVLGQPWSFIETDDDGQIVRSFTVVFTNEPAPTCVGGTWLLARIEPRPSVTIGPTMAVTTPFGTPQPAYSLEGSALQINLNSGICDSYDEFVGQLTPAGFVGYARYEGLEYGKVKGAVHGSPIHSPAKADT